MLELSRGYLAATVDAAEREGGAPAISDLVRDLQATVRLVVGSSELRAALTDISIEARERRAVIEDLLGSRVAHGSLALLSFLVEVERASDLSKVLEQVAELAEMQAASAAAGERDLGEPPIGRTGAYERIRGYAEHELEAVEDTARVDEIESELFRFARILENARDLSQALSDTETPVGWRIAVITDVLQAKVSPESVRLCCYVVRAGRVRDVVAALGYLVQVAAEERGRRVADVRAAVPLDEDESARLSAALSRLVRRPVELRVTVDPSVLGGIDVEVGNTVIDGTVRHRLERLRETLAKGA